MRNLIKYYKQLKKLDHPCRYLSSRVLVRSGLSKLFTIKTNGYKIHYFPTAISSELWLDPTKRKYKMLDYIKPGSTIIDVGANIGTTVIPAAFKTGESGTVLAFEANPKTFRYLQANIALNKINNVNAYNMALGDKQKISYITNKENDDQNEISQNNHNAHSVKEITLDSLTEDYKHINLLKIDVEGYELFVLKGAEKTLKKVQLIYIEISEIQFKKYGYTCRDVFEFLAKYKFRFVRLEKGNILEEITVNYIPSLQYESILAIKDLRLFQQLYNKQHKGVLDNE